MSRSPITLTLRLRVSLTGLALLLVNAAARADVVAVVSSKSAVTSLSSAQVADIFLGRSNRFPNGERAVPIDQPDGSVAREEFYAKLIGKTSAQLKAYWSKIIFTGRGQPPQAAPNGAEVKRRLSANPAAIGYIDSDLVDSSVKVVL